MTPSPIPPRPFAMPGQAGMPPTHQQQLYAQHNAIHSSTQDPRESLHFCFCIPFKIIPGPEPDDIILCTNGAAERWLHPTDSPLLGHHKLPVHQKNFEYLRKLCKDISESERDNCKAILVVSEPRSIKRKKRGAVINVSLSGDADTVYRMRGFILQSLPVSLVSISIPWMGKRKC